MLGCPRLTLLNALNASARKRKEVPSVTWIALAVSSDPALNQAAWENLRGVVGLLEAGDSQSEPEQRSDAWVNFSRAG